VRLIAKPEGARPVLFGFESSEEAGACVADVIAAGIVPVAIEFMDKPAIEICEPSPMPVIPSMSARF